MISTSHKGLESVPLHAPLSAKYKETFAYPTIKDRCPVILCKIIDHLHRQRLNIGRDLGTEAADGLYKVVEELSKVGEGLFVPCNDDGLQLRCVFTPPDSLYLKT